MKTDHTLDTILNPKRRRTLVLILLIASLVLIWVLSNRILMQDFRIQRQDFAQIWAAGRLALEGKDPYNPHSIQIIKKEISGTENQPQVTAILYSPPWTIPMAMVFSLLPYLVGRLLWMLTSIIILLVSASVLWRLYGGAENKRWIAWLLVFTFGPVYIQLIQGQITVWVLLGVVGFLYAEKNQNPILTGISAALVSIKPQLFYLFWPAFLLWVIKDRKWKTFTSFAGALVFMTVISAAFRSNIVGDFISVTLYYSPVLVWKTPTIGTYLRIAFNMQFNELQILPSLLGLVWFLYYWLRHHRNWNWKEQIPLLVIVSLFTTTFAWTYDYVLLISALIPAWVILVQNNKNHEIIWFSAAYALINFTYLIVHRNYTDEYFGWQLPLLTLWYWLASRVNTTKSEFPITREGSL